MFRVEKMKKTIYFERRKQVRRRGPFGSNGSYPERNWEDVMGSNSPLKDYGISAIY